MRLPYSRWEEAGRPMLRDQLAARVRDIAARGNPCPLGDEVSAEIERIIAAYERDVKGQG